MLALRSSMILYTNMRRNVSEHCKLFAMDYCWDNYYREFIKRLLCGPKRLTIQIQYIHVHRDNVKKKKKHVLINTARRRCTGKGDVTHTNMHVRAHKNSYTDCWSEDYLVCDSCMKLSETRSTNALFRSSKGVVWVFCFLHYPSLAKQEPRQLFLLSMSAIDFFFSFFATCKVLIITQLFFKILNTSLMYYTLSYGDFLLFDTFLCFEKRRGSCLFCM